jgi:hypothetical protein
MNECDASESNNTVADKESTGNVVTPRVFAQRQIVLMTHLITAIINLEDLRSTLGQSPSSKPLLFP